ncbi:hypothetical protein L9F63_010122, partial [Diploptera punctata]
VALTALYMLPAKLFLMTSGGFAQMRLEHLLPFHRMLCDHHHASSAQILLRFHLRSRHFHKQLNLRTRNVSLCHLPTGFET